MTLDLDYISLQINNSDSKLIFLTGSFVEFAAYNFAVDYNYSYLDFNMFLKENKIVSDYFKTSDATRQTNITISIDTWTQKIAYKEQKPTIIIDGFDPRKIPDLLTKSLLMQELLYLSKNSLKLKTNLVFFINTDINPIEQQILPKILMNSKIISLK
ncbi:MAG: hypothetical protein JXA54_16120 [Candidatus Heimdallarchaeota archaeon]|nr:hypothetical protein [Candidatus Heimdallarchaeota archaeon]